MGDGVVTQKTDDPVPNVISGRAPTNYPTLQLAAYYRLSVIAQARNPQYQKA
jgi:hypothetical protein